MSVEHHRIPIWRSPRRFKLTHFFAAVTENFWKPRITGFVLIVLAILVIVYWRLHVPSPGKAVAALAVAAAIMTFRDELSGLEKFCWMGVLFAFLFIEVKSIDKDRADNEDKFIEARNRQDSNFGKILEQNQKQFNATLLEMQTLYGLSRENLKLTTGSDSVPVWSVNISNRSSAVGDAMFYLQLDGRYPMRDLDITLFKSDCLTKDKKLVSSAGHSVYQQHFPSFANHPMNLLYINSTTALVHLTGNRAVFWGEAIAYNGTWSYSIKCRRVNGAWEWHLVIYKLGIGKGGIVIVRDKRSDNFPPKKQDPGDIDYDDCEGS